jgi:hypothetical protein
MRSRYFYAPKPPPNSGRAFALMPVPVRVHEWCEFPQCWVWLEWYLWSRAIVVTDAGLGPGDETHAWEYTRWLAPEREVA